jgi:hypothetical protein
MLVLQFLYALNPGRYSPATLESHTDEQVALPAILKTDSTASVPQATFVIEPLSQYDDDTTTVRNQRRNIYA